MPGHGYSGSVPRLLHVCTVPGCANLTPSGRCEDHARGSDTRSRAYRAQRELVLERDGQRCQAVVLGADPAECGGGLQAHHIQPVELGGTDEPENMVCLCRSHNNAARRSRPPRWVKDLELIGPPALRRRVAASTSAERPALIEGGNWRPSMAAILR
jgi:hypothetical protein